MNSSEARGSTPQSVIREIEADLKRTKENKYAFQVGLKDLDFDVNTDLLQTLGMQIPIMGIDQAELALRMGGIQPKSFWEFDQTQHQVLVFDPRPIGYSGFMNCATHSLTLTDQGLFEVGRYPAMSLESHSRYWGWFLHRRLANPEEIVSLQADYKLDTSQLVERVFAALVGS